MIQALKDVPIDLIDRCRYQPRTVFDLNDLEELASSIKEKTLIHPIALREIGDRYELIAGERRWRAFQLLGRDRIPSTIKSGLSEEQISASCLMENVQRSSLNIFDEASGFQQHISRFGSSHEELGQLCGKSRSYVSNTLRFLELDQHVRDLVLSSEVSFSPAHAKVLISLEPEQRKRFAAQALQGAWSVDILQQKVSQYKSLFAKPKHVDEEKRVLDIHFNSVQETLSEHLGTPVRIDYNQKNDSGKIVISFNSTPVAEGILSKIGPCRDDT